MINCGIVSTSSVSSNKTRVLERLFQPLQSLLLKLIQCLWQHHLFLKTSTDMPKFSTLEDDQISINESDTTRVL